EGEQHIKGINSLPNAEIKREYIIKNINGMNYKEATHFLRNIGQSEELVILDRHILDFMRKVGLLDQGMEKLSKNYLLWEKMFVDFIFSPIWVDTVGKSSIPQADFAIWAARVKETDLKISYERILLLR
ncbi:MAG: hypothetical protein ACRC0X_09020, partial [Brevinema sp.]